MVSATSTPYVVQNGVNKILGKALQVVDNVNDVEATGNSRIIEVSTTGLGEIVTDKNKARTEFVTASKSFPKSVTNRNTNKEIWISRKGIDKFLSGNFSKKKYASGYKIPELIEFAQKLEKQRIDIAGTESMDMNIMKHRLELTEKVKVLISGYAIPIWEISITDIR